MKTLKFALAAVMLGTAAVQAQRPDAAAPEALLTWRDPARLEVGAIYAHLSREVELAGAEWRLRGEAVDVQLGVSPWPWLLLFGQVGASEARLRGPMHRDGSAGAGGRLGAHLNVWQIYEGVQVSSWRFTVKLAGEYAYRTARDDGAGELRWSEALVALPLDYYLSFSRTYRHLYLSELHGVGIFAGPAFSVVDGTWERRGVRTSFGEAEAAGFVAGADLWLLGNLAFGARVDWFGETSMQLNVRYRF